LGFFNNKRSQEVKDRDLKYAIIQGWADHKKLPKKEILFPISGEVIPKPKPLSKKQAQKMKDFNDYVLSGKWRNKNG